MKLAIIVTIPDHLPLKSTLGRWMKRIGRQYQIRVTDIRDWPDAPQSSAASETPHQTPQDARLGVGPTQTTSDAIDAPALTAEGLLGKAVKVSHPLGWIGGQKDEW
jgi:hypothetical protein